MIKFSFVFKIVAIALLIFIIKFRFFDNHTGWKTIVDTDGRGYYAHLPAIFIYHDLTYDFIVDCESKVNLSYSRGKFYLTSGQRGNKYFIGEAILLLPFFLLATLISFISFQGVSGYNVIFYSSVALAAWFYLMAGIYYLRKLLLLFNIREKWIILISLALVFATNLFYYTVVEPSMSHVYSFFTITFFLYQIKNFQITDNAKELFLAAAALGLITIIRPVNILIVLAVPFLMGSFKEFQNLLMRIITRPRYLLPALFLFSSVIFIQLLIYYLSYGSFIRWPYAGEGFDFSNPHVMEILFGYSHGMFLYVPLMLLAIFSILFYFKKSVFATMSFVIFFLLIVYVISSWGMWFYGGGFATRPLVEFYSLFALPLVIGLNEIKNEKYFPGFMILAVLLSFLCLFQTYQFTQQIICYDGMTEEKYWKVFLKSNKYYRLVCNPPANLQLGKDSLELKNKYLLDFEVVKENQLEQFINSGATPGSKSEVVNKKYSFSDVIQVTGKTILDNGIQYAEVNVMVNAPEGFCDALLVLSLEGPDKKIYQYSTYPAGLLMKDEKAWKKITFGVKLSQVGPNDHMGVYVWNPSDKTIYIDDLQVELFSVKGK